MINVELTVQAAKSSVSMTLGGASQCRWLQDAQVTRWRRRWRKRRGRRRRRRRRRRRAKCRRGKVVKDEATRRKKQGQEYWSFEKYVDKRRRITKWWTIQLSSVLLVGNLPQGNGRHCKQLKHCSLLQSASYHAATVTLLWMATIVNCHCNCNCTNI